MHTHFKLNKSKFGQLAISLIAEQEYSFGHWLVTVKVAFTFENRMKRYQVKK